MADLVSRVLSAITQREGQAPKIHAETCGLVLGSISGNLNDECDCGVPAEVTRLCQAHRDIVARYEHARSKVARLIERDASLGLQVAEQRAANELERVLRDVARGLGIEDTP